MSCPPPLDLPGQRRPVRGPLGRRRAGGAPGRHRRRRRRGPRLQPGHGRRGPGPGRRRRPAGGRRGRPRPAGRGAGGPEGQPVHPGRAHHLLVPHPRGVAAPLRRHGGDPPAAGRGGGGGQDQHGRVRHGLVHRDLGVRTDPQPPRHRPGPGGILGGIGRRRGRRVRPPGPRLGHRGIDPPAGRPVRGGGHEAHLRHGVPLRPGGLRQLAGPDRAVRHHGGRRRPPLRRHRRPRPRRLDLAQPSHPAGPLGPRRRRGRPDRGRADRAPRRRRPRRGGPGPPGRRGPVPPPGPGWRRSRCPR